MVRYALLVNWTEKGIADFKATVDRVGKARTGAAKMGGRVLDIVWTIGPYDLVVMVEFPDDESFAAWSLQLGSAGNIRTTSMRAFGEQEMTAILGRIT